jgi:hypothetical protein
VRVGERLGADRDGEEDEPEREQALDERVSAFGSQALPHLVTRPR